MPKLFQPLPDTHETISRPIATSVIRGLIAMTGMQNPRISFPGYDDISPQFDSAVVQSHSDNYTNWGGDNKISMTITEKREDGLALTENQFMTDQLNLFEDRNLIISMTPVRHLYETAIEVTYRGDSEREVSAWRDTIANSISSDVEYYTHDATINITVPKAFLIILNKIHELRETQGGYGQSVSEYLNTHSAKGLVALTNLNGQHPTIAFKEFSENILAWFDFTEPPVADKVDGTSVWKISFTYNYRYDKPIGMTMRYPISIHNQLLPVIYRGDNVTPSYQNMRGSKSLSNHTFDFFRTWDAQPVPIDETIRKPKSDEWYPTRIPPAYGVPFVGLCQVKESDINKVISLNDITNPALDSEIVSYLLARRTEVLKYSRTPIAIGIYQQDRLMDHDELELLSTGDIVSVEPLNIRDNYHLVIFATIDYGLIPTEELVHLLNRTDLCLKLLKAMSPEIEKRGLLPVPVKAKGGGMTIDHRDFYRAVNILRDTNGEFKTMVYRPQMLVYKTQVKF